MRRVQFIDAIEHDGVGFLKLFAKDVGGLRRETRVFRGFEDTQTVAGLEQHRIGSDLEAVAIQILERLHDRGDEIRTAADRLGENHIWLLAAFQLLDLADQIIESTAEAGARHLLDGKALRAQAGGVHQILSLIVGDEADLLAAIEVEAGQTRQRRGFAGAEEATDHDEAQLFHWRTSLPVSDAS